MNYLTTYNSEGMVVSTLESTDPLTINLNKVGLWIEEKANPQTDYVLNGKVTPRPEQNTYLSKTGSLHNLPSPCTIEINGQIFEETDTELQLEFDQPIVYSIKISAFPFLDKAFEFDNEKT